MVLGLEFGASNITFVAFGNNISEIIKDPARVGEIFVLQQGVIPIEGNIKKAIETLINKLQTCNITQVGFSNNIGPITVNHIKDIEKLRNTFYPDYSTIIDIGAKNTKIYTFEGQKLSNTYTNGKCAAGSGSFIETMADRLDFTLPEFIKTALETEEYASLSGRCAVFCESDIVHLFQKGITKDKIAHGITRVVALNVKSILENRPLGAKALFVGGVSQNKAVLRDLRKVFDETQVDTTKFPFGAFATVFSAYEMNKGELKELLTNHFGKEVSFEYDEPLSLSKSQIDAPPTEKSKIFLVAPLKPISKKSYDFSGALGQGVQSTLPCPSSRSRGEEASSLNVAGGQVEKEARAEEKKPIHYQTVALGVDIGSVSTKAALIGEKDNKPPVLLTYYYRKTQGDPLTAVKDVIEHIANDIKEKNITFDKCYAGTTGSGRYLTGDFLGADVIKNEITAQVAGTVWLYPKVDTIFEIGGQDSKYISLKNGEITDFEMNRVCAAGTGAFLEKQAKILGVSIEEFGDLALKNKRPPILDYNCTVFTEMAMKEALNTVPREDLAASVCLASAKNYLNKNVDHRKIGDKIVFSGAVAFNKGMVAAFEALCGKEITVSQYPHINGAMGIAYLTLSETREKEPKFKGFEEIIKQKYKLSTFKCQGCDNFCDVSVFETITDGELKKFYYNDRCEKYSGKPQGAYQVNLFDKYNDIMNETLERVPRLNGLKTTIGYPRGMFFNQYYPLFGAFFKACGFNIVLSDETNKTIAEKGSLLAGTKPCFPFKCAFGHFDNILSKRCDYIFLPRIITAPVTTHKNTHYCPFMLAGCDILVKRRELSGIQNNMDRPLEEGDKILSPTIYMSRGEKEVKSILTKMGEALGVNPKIAKKATQIAWDAYLDFKDDLINTGKNTLDLYKDYIYIVLGHPYVLYDNFLNMNIGEKLSKMGYMPIPMDFISPRTNTPWHIYQKEIEKKLKIGAYLKEHREMKSIILSYYACGMDAFSNKFFKEETDTPCYVMNMDEHTSDAGVQTRLEAFADVQYSKSESRAEKSERKNVGISDLSKVKNKILWLPATDFSSEILAKAFNLFDINAKVLPESEDHSFEEARKEISEDVCLPCLVTLEDMLNRIKSPDFDPEKEAFFQAGSNGPCRLGMYPQRQKIAVNDFVNTQCTMHNAQLVTPPSPSGGWDSQEAPKSRQDFLENGNVVGGGESFPNVIEGAERSCKKFDIPITIIDNNYFKSGLDINFGLLTWNALLVHDMIKKLYLHSRPYEMDEGSSRKVYEKYAYSLVTKMHIALRQIKKQSLKNFEGVPIFDSVLKEACEAFEAVSDHSRQKPIIGITGEFYLKLNDRANKNIVKYLESKGFEVTVSTTTEYFHYSNYITLSIVNSQLNSKMDYILHPDLTAEKSIRETVQKIIDQQEMHYNTIIAPFAKGLLEIPSKDLVKLGSKLVHPSVTGEPIVALGKGGDYFYNNIKGVINIAPFNCMPGGVIQLLGEVFRREYENLPFLSLFYDGYEDNYDRIDNFISNISV